MDYQEVRHIARNYAELVAQTFKIRLVVLFGSHVRGQACKYSDIDLAVFVEGEEANGGYLEQSIALCRCALKIDPHIEPHLFYAAVLQSVEQASFVSDILSNGEIIYGTKGHL